MQKKDVENLLNSFGIKPGEPIRPYFLITKPAWVIIYDAEIPKIINWVKTFFSEYSWGEGISGHPSEYAFFIGSNHIKITHCDDIKGQFILWVVVNKHAMGSAHSSEADFMLGRAEVNLCEINQHRIQVLYKYNHLYFRYYLSELFSSMNKYWRVVSEDKFITIAEKPGRDEADNQPLPQEFPKGGIDAHSIQDNGLPKRKGDLDKWRNIWNFQINNLVTREGMDAKAVIEELKKRNKNAKYRGWIPGIDTMKKIIQAGTDGKL